MKGVVPNFGTERYRYFALKVKYIYLFALYTDTAPNPRSDLAPGAAPVGSGGRQALQCVSEEPLQGVMRAQVDAYHGELRLYHRTDFEELEADG